MDEDAKNKIVDFLDMPPECLVLNLIGANKMTISERKRTCSYCMVTYQNAEKFSEHWRKCQVRMKNGYIKEVKK